MSPNTFADFGGRTSVSIHGVEKSALVVNDTKLEQKIDEIEFFFLVGLRTSPI